MILESRAALATSFSWPFRENALLRDVFGQVSSVSIEEVSRANDAALRVLFSYANGRVERSFTICFPNCPNGAFVRPSLIGFGSS